MLARAVSTAFATPAAAPNTASPPGSARSRPGSARHVASPTRSDSPSPGPHAQVDGRRAALVVPLRPAQRLSGGPSAQRSGTIRRSNRHAQPISPPSNLAQSRPARPRQAACQPPAPTRQELRHPTPGSVPGGARTRTDTYARACGAEIFRKKIRVRETARRPRPGSRSVPWGGGREGDTGSRACAADSLGGRMVLRGYRGASGARTAVAREFHASIRAWS